MSFERLPRELHLLILDHCPDVPTLLAAISTVPQFRRLYYAQQHRLLASVVQNQFGINLSKVLSLLDSAIQTPIERREQRPLPLLSFENLQISWPVDKAYLSIANVKRLLDLDSRVDCLIRECMYLQFGAWIQLSPRETYSVRRGMYNFIHAAMLSRQPSKACNIQTLNDFYLSLSTIETLEILYMLHCLRDLAKDHFRRLSEFLFDQIMDGYIVTDLQTQDSIFGPYGLEARDQWCRKAPWMLDLAKLNSLATPVTDLEFYRFYPEDVLSSDDVWTWSAPFGHFDPMEDRLEAQIPTNCDPCELGANNAYSGSSSLLHGDDMLDKIATGFMIWDQDHWDQLRAKQSIPSGMDANAFFKKEQTERNRTVLGKLRKWSWTVHGRDYHCEPGPRKFPRGKPSVIGPIEASRRLEIKYRDWAIKWAESKTIEEARRKSDEARQRLYYSKTDLMGKGCDLPYRIDWKKGTLTPDPKHNAEF